MISTTDERDRQEQSVDTSNESDVDITLAVDYNGRYTFKE